MAAESSFDVVSKVDMQEVRNAVDQASREIETRFDFKGSDSSLDLDDKAGTIKLASADETRLNSMVDVLKTKLHRRGIDVKAIDLGKMEEGSKGSVRQTATLRQGVDIETARKLVKMVKDTGLKVQAAIQGDQVRISAKSKDDLQQVMTTLREADLNVPLQFVNRR
jgi:hypothetical protein